MTRCEGRCRGQVKGSMYAVQSHLRAIFYTESRRFIVLLTRSCLYCISRMLYLQVDVMIDSCDELINIRIQLATNKYMLDALLEAVSTSAPCAQYQQK